MTAGFLHAVFAIYGLAALFLLVMAESAGVPLPGETALVRAALYAGSTGHLSIEAVIAAAGAIVGDIPGFLAGRRFGAGLVSRFGGRIGLTPPRWRLARCPVRRYGLRAVSAGRFIAILRSLAIFIVATRAIARRSEGWRREADQRYRDADAS